LNAGIFIFKFVLAIFGSEGLEGLATAILLMQLINTINTKPAMGKNSLRSLICTGFPLAICRAV
jgi:hypothetical protein